MFTRLIAILVLATAACGQTTPIPTPSAPGPVAPAPVIADPPGLAITDVACAPKVPDWEVAFFAGYNWSMVHANDFDGIATARARASAVIDALPTTDPRYIEAHCRVAFAHHNQMDLRATEHHLRTALTALRARGIADAERRYDALRDPVFGIGIDLPDPGSGDPRVWLETTVGTARDPDRCRDPDVAFLELELADVYRHVKNADAKRWGFTPRKPRGRSTGSMATDHAAALQDEVEAALGPTHRYAFTMRERMTWHCREPEQRRAPKRCPDLEALQRDNLEGRLAALGADDPDTRRNLLYVGAEHMAAERTAQAVALFERAAAGEARDEIWIVAQQLLSGLELAAGKDREGFARLQRVAAAVPDGIRDDYWSTRQAWALHERQATRTGHRDEAGRARAAQEQVERDYHYVGPGGSGLAMIAWTAGTPLHTEAIEAAVREQTRALRWLDRPGGRPSERTWRTTELDGALQCRAIVRHRAGDTAGAEADLRALERLRATAPAPKP